MSLSGRSSPRATDPNTRTFRAPWRAAVADGFPIQLDVLRHGLWIRLPVQALPDFTR